MGKRNYGRRPDADHRRAKEGRGKGTGEDYLPWIETHHFGSKGIAQRTKGSVVDRIHHTLSHLEQQYLDAIEWLEGIRDIREQKPLDPSNTTAIARRLGFPHPWNRSIDEPFVMTTDFVFTIEHQGVSKQFARSVKPSSELNKPSVLKKLEIERLYWEAQGVDWGIITERDIPRALVLNAEWVKGFEDPARLPVPIEDVQMIDEILRSLLVKYPQWPLKQVTRACDNQFGYAAGTALTVVKHLIASRLWKVDMLSRVQVDEPLRVIDLFAWPKLSVEEAGNAAVGKQPGLLA